ncbi:MAG: serine/threonine protein kinase, partial [Polyangiaceae bacterium]|nr:serine/threonine protein kinase [Polyangiaceae bacterium]
PSAADLAAALGALLPHGHAIVDAMLVPLGATTRAFVAPRGALPEMAATAPATTLGTTGARPPGGTRVGVIALSALAASIAGGAAVYWIVRGSPGAAPVAEPAPAAAPASAAASAAAPASAAVSAAAPVSAAASAAAPASASAAAPASAPASSRRPLPTRPPRSDDETSRK